MRMLLGSLLAATRFLTVLPLGRSAPAARELRGAVLFFPLVGVFLGLALAVLYAWFAAWPDLVRGALLLAALVLFTGALHLDGFADTCDGLAGTTPERRLAIMADTYIGVYGVVGVICLLVLKFAALVALAALGPPAALAALITAPLLGRWTIVLVTAIFPYARGPDGLGYHFKQGARGPGFLVSTLFTAVIIGALAWWWSVSAPVLALAAVIPLACGAGWWLTRRLGGLTGDTYGAICEVVETFVLVLFVVLPWGL